MSRIRISLTLKQAAKQFQNIGSAEPKGIFIHTGSFDVVDRIVGYHKKRGFVADYCYHTGNHWLVDLFRSLFRKNGFVRITTFI